MNSHEESLYHAAHERMIDRQWDELDADPKCEKCDEASTQAYFGEELCDDCADKAKANRDFKNEEVDLLGKSDVYAAEIERLEQEEIDWELKKQQKAAIMEVTKL